MRTATLCSIVLLSLMACSGEEPPATSEVARSQEVIADAVYTNGRIYTVNEQQPWVEAIAVKDGKFLVVGSESDVQAVTGDATQVVDLAGRMVMPGLIDTHIHVMGASIGKANLYLSNPNDIDAMLAEIKAYADANPDLPYIRGESYNLGVFENNSPRKELLDEIIPDRPVYFYSQTGHEAWVNSKTLELINIDELEQDNRYIWDTDPETGEATGTIREYTMSLVEQALGATDPQRIAPVLAETLDMFSVAGFTALKEAGAEVWTVEAANLLDKQGQLGVRLFPAWFHLGHIGAMTPEESREVATDWENYRTPMVYPRYVKMYGDGAPSSYASLLLDDYSDRPGFRGTTNFTLEELIEDFAYFNENEIGMIVHAFADGTSGVVIEAFEAVRERNGDNGIPLHFSHSVMATEEQIERLAQISDISMDFITLPYPHDAMRGSFVPPIGEERWQQWIKVRSAVDVGIPFSFGSDWPAALRPIPNAFFEMQGFITREDPANPVSGTLNESQAITLEQAVYGYTLGGAETLGFDWPERIGSIEEGKNADFIVIDRNIFEIPVKTLKDTQVDMTFVGGRRVFDRDARVAELDVVKIEITNPDLQNAVDAADLNLLVEDELGGGGHGCLEHDQDIEPGSSSAPSEVNLAFASLTDQGHRFARPAREIYWKSTDADYWIQWTLRDDAAVLWAFDPEAGQVVEILQVKER